jgi:hypothetical protein
LSETLDRRKFLAGAVGATLSMAISSCSPRKAKETLAQAQRVRRSVRGMSADDPVLASYTKAIKLMRSLGRNDPSSWEFQVNLHAGGCHEQHFWPWHRMFLYRFERIVSKISEDAHWAIPYWNYSNEDEHCLPEPFRAQPSPLWIGNRLRGWNDGTLCLSPDHASYRRAFVSPNFFRANGAVFGTPHMSVHGDIGGPMQILETSPRDPIFYLHHSNIDRLWDLWLTSTSGASDPLWYEPWKSLSFPFYDEDGQQVQMTACDVLRAKEQLGYSYEGAGTQPNQVCTGGLSPTVFVELPIDSVQIERIPTTVGEGVSRHAIKTAGLKDLASLLANGNNHILLTLDELQADRPPGAVWDVYVGPTGLEPIVGSPFFVGVLTLFGAGIKTSLQYKGSTSAVYVIDEALEQSIRRDASGIEMVFSPSGPLRNGKVVVLPVEAPISVGKASIKLETARAR